MQIGAEADLTYAHLRDDRADCSVYSDVCVECRFSRFDTEPMEVSSVLGCFPGCFPFGSHCSSNNGFCRCHERSETVRFYWGLESCSRVRVVTRSYLGRLIRQLVPYDSLMGWNPLESDIPPEASGSFQCCDRLDKDVLTRWVFGIAHGLDGRLVVGEDDTFC